MRAKESQPLLVVIPLDATLSSERVTEKGRGSFMITNDIVQSCRLRQRDM